LIQSEINPTFNKFTKILSGCFYARFLIIVFHVLTQYLSKCTRESNDTEVIVNIITFGDIS